MRINIGDIEINYIKEGRGEAVLVLHGWGASIDTVIPIVRILKPYFQVYALDLPGFGVSTSPKEVFGTRDYARLVKEFIDIMDIKDLVLIGHSFGGKISILVGANYPELVNKMVLINSSGLKPRRGLDYYLKVYTYKTMKLFYKVFLANRIDDKNMERFHNRLGSRDYRDSKGIMRKILVKVVNEDLSPILKNIKSPTLLIWGDKDITTPLYMGQIMERRIPDSGLVVLKGADHYSYLDAYDKFAIILKSFLLNEH